MSLSPLVWGQRRPSGRCTGPQLYTNRGRPARRGEAPRHRRRGADSAVPTRRELAGVHGLLEELLGVVLPELAHRRVGVDHRVLELAVDALDLADVDVLGGVAVGVHLDGAARGVLDLGGA